MREVGLDEQQTLSATDSSFKTVRVHGVRHLSPALLSTLGSIAAPLLRLEWDFKPVVIEEDLFSSVKPLIEDEIPRGSRTHAPIYDLAASAGAFGQSALPERLGFVHTGVRTGHDDFVITVRGRSMEPTIRDGSMCVFRHEATGSHHDRRVILAQLREDGDPEYGGRYTVKRLHLAERRLVPDNDAFSPIRVRPEDIHIIGVYLRTLASA